VGEFFVMVGIDAVGVGQSRRRAATVLAALTTTALVVFGLAVGAPAASAAQSSVDLGTADPFAVLAGTTVTNTGLSVISGDLGISPGDAVTGFPPGLVINGTEHAGDAVAAGAQADLTTAYNDAAGRTPPTAAPADIGGQTLVAGVYKNATSIGLTGTVTLDAQGDPNAVFVFQAGSTLITASNSTVQLINGASPCNVFWQVGSSATLGTDTTFVGNVLALTSATVQTGTTVDGRVLARNGAVTLDSNTITRPDCATTPPTTTTTTPPTTTTTTPPTTTTTTPPTTTTTAGGGTGGGGGGTGGGGGGGTGGGTGGGGGGGTGGGGTGGNGGGAGGGAGGNGGAENGNGNGNGPGNGSGLGNGSEAGNGNGVGNGAGSGGGQVSEVPVGPVDTGDGSTE
jgi:ice-binding like protein